MFDSSMRLIALPLIRSSVLVDQSRIVTGVQILIATNLNASRDSRNDTNCANKNKPPQRLWLAQIPDYRQSNK